MPTRRATLLMFVAVLELVSPLAFAQMSRRFATSEWGPGVRPQFRGQTWGSAPESVGTVEGASLLENHGTYLIFGGEYRALPAKIWYVFREDRLSAAAYRFGRESGLPGLRELYRELVTELTDRWGEPAAVDIVRGADAIVAWVAGPADPTAKIIIRVSIDVDIGLELWFMTSEYYGAVAGRDWPGSSLAGFIWQ